MKRYTLDMESTYTYYSLKVYAEGYGWFYPSFDTFGYPHEEFKPSGQCWQRTGREGTFSLEVAMEAMESLIKAIELKKSSVTEVAIVQETRIIKTKPIRKVTRYA